MSYTYTLPGIDLTGKEALGTVTPYRLRAIEDPRFPFEELSEIAELESWRKEINRPIYHLHKWWAQRLGSVFRAILIGAATTDPTHVMSAFYSQASFPDLVVFDPFMGSGTTIGEAVKLGMRGIGRDINRVAYFGVKTALRQYKLPEITAAFQDLERNIAPWIKRYYRTQTENGTLADVLYYFWVKTVRCPSCTDQVDLFSSYIFAKHAYPATHPEAQALCPHCGAINSTRYDAMEAICRRCGDSFAPQQGPAERSKAICPTCRTSFPIAEAIRLQATPPTHRLYAKLVLLTDGRKVYQQADGTDIALYDQAIRDLAERRIPYPLVAIQPGHNTNQVLNYRYQYWHEMFNARQLLALSLLAEGIQAIEHPNIRELFVCLYSGALEFNNMFASYKGEGTGAVRHMFAHHILKPERTPIEANVWGTPKSSGAFSTLYKGRLLRALEYQQRPFEIRPIDRDVKRSGVKVYGLSDSMARTVVDSYADLTDSRKTVYLSCDDSSSTDIPRESVDLVVTDPPFFDNVHYSELADFFHVWQRHLLGSEHEAATTRSAGEVQSADVRTFSERLGAVFSECRRVLRPDGLMIFTYHHSRSEGWQAILDSLVGAGFVITAAHPIKSEMSVATPKSQAKHPIDLDIILVCRPREATPLIALSLPAANVVARDQVHRLVTRGRKLGRNDVLVIVMSQIIRVASQRLAIGEAIVESQAIVREADEAIEQIYREVVNLEDR